MLLESVMIRDSEHNLFLLNTFKLPLKLAKNCSILLINQNVVFVINLVYKHGRHKGIIVVVRVVKLLVSDR